MEQETSELLDLLNDEYIGDELTAEDLRSAYSAFLEDERSSEFLVMT